MIRGIAIVTALAAASASVPAIAQSYGGLTLTFGNGGYNRYDYDEDYYYDRSGQQIYRPQFERRYRYNNPYEQRSYQRELQLYQWRLQQWQEQQRRYYWEQQRRDHDWRYDDDDD
jgi:hypothetical protein